MKAMKSAMHSMESLHFSQTASPPSINQSWLLKKFTVTSKAFSLLNGAMPSPKRLSSELDDVGIFTSSGVDVVEFEAVGVWVGVECIDELRVEVSLVFVVASELDLAFLGMMEK